MNAFNNMFRLNTVRILVIIGLFPLLNGVISAQAYADDVVPGPQPSSLNSQLQEIEIKKHYDQLWPFVDGMARVKKKKR